MLALVSAGIEFIFSVVPRMRLCFEIVLKTVLITQGWLLLSSACTMSRPFLLLTLPCQQVAWGAQEIWRGCSWEIWSQLTKWIFETIRHCVQQYKLAEEEEEEERGGRWGRWHLSSQGTVTGNGALFSCRWLNT